LIEFFGGFGHFGSQIDSTRDADGLRHQTTGGIPHKARYGRAVRCRHHQDGKLELDSLRLVSL